LRILSYDLLMILLARGFFGLFLATVLGFGSWAIIRDSVPTPDSDSASFFLVHAAMAGGPAALGAALAWWNTESSGRAHLLAVFLTMGITVMSTWLVFEIWEVETYNALFGGVYRIPVISTSDMLTKMMTAAVVSANAVAATFYLYRALRYRDF